MGGKAHKEQAISAEGIKKRVAENKLYAYVPTHKEKDPINAFTSMLQIMNGIWLIIPLKHYRKRKA